jgi:hypothetical protein
MSYQDWQRRQWGLWEPSEDGEQKRRRSVSPGKRTLTMSLPPRPSGVLSPVQAPVQQKADPAAVLQHKERTGLIDQWMEVVARPDLSSAPVPMHGDGAESGIPMGESGEENAMVDTSPLEGDEIADDARGELEEPGAEPSSSRSPSIQGASMIQRHPDEIHAAAQQGVAGSGAKLPYQAEIQRSFGAQHDLSPVRSHIGGSAAAANEAMGSLAYTRGEHMAFPASPDLRLVAHEAAHVIQQRHGVALGHGVGTPGDAYEQAADTIAERVVAGQSAAVLLPASSGHAGQSDVVQHAIPAAVIWGGKAIAATTFDAFIDFAIAAILGLPAPGALDHVGNFLVNLVPFLGEAKKAKKIAKLLRMVGKIVAPIKKMKELKIPGANKLFDNLVREASKLKANIRSLDLDAAKQTFGRLLGYVREAQVATKLHGQGAAVEHLGKLVKAGGKPLTDIDVVTREGGQLVFTQVKSGNAAKLTKGSDSWIKFENQAQRTKEAADAIKASNGGVAPKVRYVVDDITPEAKAYLEDLGFIVESAGKFLK